MCDDDGHDNDCYPLSYLGIDYDIVMSEYGEDGINTIHSLSACYSIVINCVRRNGTYCSDLGPKNVGSNRCYSISLNRMVDGSYNWYQVVELIATSYHDVPH